MGLEQNEIANLREPTYSHLMGKNPAHLTLKLDTDEPIELGDFVGAFTSLANEFERYVAGEYPDAKADPRIYIREVRSGCIEADIVTGLTLLAGSAIVHMDQILILEDFVKRWGARITSLVTNQVPDGELSTASQLNDFYRAAESIASDPVANHRLEAAVYEDSKRGVKAAFEFSAIEARTAQQNIEDRKKLLARPSASRRKRVLMVYTRTDIHDAKINKRSSERVVIRDISGKDLPVMYASELVEQEVRQQIREADENVYKKGFVVDVSAQMLGERIAAYSIMAFHHTIDLD